MASGDCIKQRSASAHITAWYDSSIAQDLSKHTHTRAFRQIPAPLLTYTCCSSSPSPLAQKLLLPCLSLSLAQQRLESRPPILPPIAPAETLDPPSLRFVVATAEPHHLTRHRHTSTIFSPRPCHVINTAVWFTSSLILLSYTSGGEYLAAASVTNAQERNILIAHSLTDDIIAAQNLIAPRQTMPS